MREIKRLRPHIDPVAWQKYQNDSMQAALAILEPHRYCGHRHLADAIGCFVVEQHNEMTKICAGISKASECRDQRYVFATRCAAAGLLNAAIIRAAADPNTQWDDRILFYDQLVNHLRNLTASTMPALAVEL